MSCLKKGWFKVSEVSKLAYSYVQLSGLPVDFNTIALLEDKCSSLWMLCNASITINLFL